MHTGFGGIHNEDQKLGHLTLLVGFPSRNNVNWISPSKIIKRKKTIGKVRVKYQQLYQTIDRMILGI